MGLVYCYIISTQKQPDCKKGAALFKIASVKKDVKSKGAAKKWLWWYRLMAKSLITILVNLCCLIPASLEISTKFTWIVVIKLFAINLHMPSQLFLGRPFDFTTFFTLAILNRAAPFFTARLFLSIVIFLWGFDDSSWCLKRVPNLAELLTGSSWSVY